MIGFTHTTFAFQYETAIHRLEIKSSDVKPGALISFLQKGLQFSEVETHLIDGREIKCSNPFTLIGQHHCNRIKSSEKEEQEERDALEKLKKDQLILKRERREERRKSQLVQNEKRARKDSALNEDDSRMDIDFTCSSIRILQGHTSEVFVCGWHPKQDLVATGSGDGTARIWTIPDDSESPCSDALVLQHSEAEKRDVTTLEWSPNGEYLATGSYDGVARVWTKQGELMFKMVGHEGPIFCLKWNRRGDLIATGSVDKSAIVWDASTGSSRQQFGFHSAPTLDIAWKDDVTFASSSADNQIYICQLGSFEPFMQFTGHASEVNAIRWDPSGKYLASCSDDKTAKIWTMEQETPHLDLTQHTREVYMARWCTDPSRLWLATASFDSTIKIWDINDGSCLLTLKGHKEAIYSVSFHPEYNYIASGSADRSVYIWSLTDGTIVNTWAGAASIYEVAFNESGTKLAACTSDNKGVKKPFNPILGEFFRCMYNIDGHDAFWICEQVSHHPPITAYFYCCPKKNIHISGEMKPRAGFSGNSAHTKMEGGFQVFLRGTTYSFTCPNVYARNLLIGKMYMELGDKSFISTSNDDYSAELEFKFKPFFGHVEDNQVHGIIKHEGKICYRFKGSWTGVIYMEKEKKDKKDEKIVLADTTIYPILQRAVTPIEHQEEFESRRLWQNVAKAIKMNDQSLATLEKTKIEDNQRATCKKREESGEKWEPRFFQLDQGKWRLKVLKEPTVVKARDEFFKEQIIRTKEITIINDKLKWCYRKEGVNHLENCKELADQYFELLGGVKGAWLKGFKPVLKE